MHILCIASSLAICQILQTPPFSYLCMFQAAFSRGEEWSLSLQLIYSGKFHLKSFNKIQFYVFHTHGPKLKPYSQKVYVGSLPYFNLSPSISNGSFNNRTVSVLSCLHGLDSFYTHKRSMRTVSPDVQMRHREVVQLALNTELGSSTEGT